MRKLLFNSLTILFMILGLACSNKSNKAIKSTAETVDSTITKISIDSVAVTDSAEANGDTIKPQSSNNEGGKKGSVKNEMKIKHNAPDQDRIDSIKRAKTKGKK